MHQNIYIIAYNPSNILHFAHSHTMKHELQKHGNKKTSLG
jgi:hypothetical protein